MKKKSYSWNLDTIFTNKEFEKIVADFNTKKQNFSYLTDNEKKPYKRLLIKYYTFCNLKLYLNKENKLYMQYKKILGDIYCILFPVTTNQTNYKRTYLSYLDKISRRQFIYKGKRISYDDISYSKKLNSRDGEFRRSVFLDYLENIYQNKDTLTTIFINMKKNQSYIIPKNFNKLQDLLESTIPLFNQYFLLKKKIQHLDKIYFCDLFTNHENEKVEYALAKEMVTNSLQVLQMNEIIEAIWENNWIDVYPKKKKVGSYFSIKSYDINPYILLNYHNTYKDLFLLTHEIGHSLAYFLRKKSKSYQEMENFDDMEIPSLVNEFLLAYSLLDNSPKTIANLLDGMVNNFYRYGILFLFEKELYTSFDSNRSIDPSKIYFTLKKKYFSEITFLENEKYEYLKIKHFIYSNYCYKYVNSCVISMYIVKKILLEKDFKDKYLEFLIQAESYDEKNLKKYLELDLEEEDIYLFFKNEIEKLISVLGEKYENI